MVRNDPLNPILNRVDLLGLSIAGFTELTASDKAEMAQRRYDIMGVPWTGLLGSIGWNIYDGENNSPFEAKPAGWSCEKTGKILVKKILSGSRVHIDTAYSAWKFQQVEAISNYFSLNARYSLWNRTATEIYMVLDHWHLVEELKCCWRGREFKVPARLRVVRMKTDRTENKIDYQLGRGGYYVDGVNFNVHVTPPAGGGHINPGPIDRAIPSP